MWFAMKILRDKKKKNKPKRTCWILHMCKRIWDITKGFKLDEKMQQPLEQAAAAEISCLSHNSLNKLIFQSKVMKWNAFKPYIPYRTRWNCIHIRRKSRLNWWNFMMKKSVQLNASFITVLFAHKNTKSGRKKEKWAERITIEKIRWMCDLESVCGSFSLVYVAVGGGGFLLSTYSQIWIQWKDPVMPCANTKHFKRISFYCCRCFVFFSLSKTYFPNRTHRLNYVLIK